MDEVESGNAKRVGREVRSIGRIVFGVSEAAETGKEHTTAQDCFTEGQKFEIKVIRVERKRDMLNIN